METKVKLQHYVPRCFLINFIIKPKKKSVYCFDKTNSKSFIVSTTNIASESYFYDESTQTRQEVENDLSGIESPFRHIYSTLTNSKDLSSLTPDEKNSLAYFAVAQELRTREYRETIRDMGKQLKKRLNREKLSDEFKKTYDIDNLGTEEEAKNLQLNILKDIPRYVGIFLQMKWIIFLNHTPIPLWCSDHPINRYNPIKDDLRGNLGLFSPGIEIHYPLSPKIILVFTDPTVNNLLPNKYDITDVESINFENSLQVFHSTRYIFSNINNFSLAEKILKENPSLRSLDKKRIATH